jgi:hypothetical protein
MRLWPILPGFSDEVIDDVAFPVERYGQRMCSVDTKVIEIRPHKGGFVVVVKPHYLETHVAYRKIWIEPRFDNHGGQLVEDTIEFAANTIPPDRIGETVRVYAVALEA